MTTTFTSTDTTMCLRCVCLCVCDTERERQTRQERRHVERGREREKLQVGERLLQFSSCLLGMSWLRISQNDLLGEKRREMGRRGARKREKGMKCHWGIPLSSPVLPTLSRAVHFIPLCLCPSLLPLLTFFPPSDFDENSLLCVQRSTW